VLASATSEIAVISPIVNLPEILIGTGRGFF
jgi:hypothetical protein